MRAVRAAREHGLQVGIYNLVGLPTETRKEFMETVKMNRLCQPDWFLLSVFFPYPGTELHRRCEELGLLKRGLNHELERRKPALDLPGFSKLEIAACRTLFPCWFTGATGHGGRSCGWSLWPRSIPTKGSSSYTSDLRAFATWC